MDNENPTVECWACKVTVAVPYLNGKPADTFKCGWCGALNELQQVVSPQQQRLQQEHTLQTLAPEDGAHNSRHDMRMCMFDMQSATAPGTFALLFPSAHAHRRHKSSFKLGFQRCCTACMHIWRWAVVVFVVLLVSSIAGTGIWMLLPRLCTTWATYIPNLMFAALLLLNVLFNYAAAVVQSPGKVNELVPLPCNGQYGQVPPGSFDLYTYCKPCRGPKPPHAHHCRACGHCVVDMDHHCPFIANCVGRGNLRPFLLFLGWALTAAAYVLLMCSILVWQQWDVVRSSTSLHATLNSSSLGAGAGSIISSMPVNPTLINATRHGHVGGSGATTSSSNHSGIVEAWVTAGAVPAAAVVTATGEARHWSTGCLIATTGWFFVLLQLAPGWLLATYYLAAASTALLLGLGTLLCSQLSYLARGLTYVQHLKGAAISSSNQSLQQHGGGVVNGSNRQQYAPPTTEAVISSQVCLQSTQEAGKCPLPFTTPRNDQPGKHRVLWMRVGEVLGAESSISSCLNALVVPKWRVSTPLASAGPKKWT